MPTKGIESISKKKVSGVLIFILARLEAESYCSIVRTGVVNAISFCVLVRYHHHTSSTHSHCRMGMPTAP